MEERMFLPGPAGGRIEARLARAGGAIGAVISHPHPLMGGDMENPVVGVITETLHAEGFSTLRFNFRGVGESDGAFDDGRGEQQDLLHAIRFLEQQGVREVLTAGYSFGAWVNAAAALRSELLPALFVAPPVELLEFDFVGLRGRIGMIVCGDRDPYCPVARLQGLATSASCPVRIIPGADHFFMTRQRELAASIADFAATFCPADRESRR